MSADADAFALAQEVRRLEQTGQPGADFRLRPFAAYTLAAVLQFASRNPQLSSWQRDMTIDIARRCTEQLVQLADATIGPGSLVARTLERGFDPRHDVAAEGHINSRAAPREAAR